MTREHLLKNINNLLGGLTEEQLEKIMHDLRTPPDEAAKEETQSQEPQYDHED